MLTAARSVPTVSQVWRAAAANLCNSTIMTVRMMQRCIKDSSLASHLMALRSVWRASQLDFGITGVEQHSRGVEAGTWSIARWCSTCGTDLVKHLLRSTTSMICTAGGPKLARTPVSGRPPLTPAMAAQLGRTPGSNAAAPASGGGGARFGQRFAQYGGVFPPTPSVRQTILERVTFQVPLRQDVSPTTNAPAFCSCHTGG